MPNMTYTVSLQVGSASEDRISGSLTAVTDAKIVNNPTDTIPAAVAGTLTTRTSNTEGVITFSSHSFTVSDKIGIFWSGGQRHYVTVDSADVTTVTFSAGSGDNLPADESAVTVSKPLELDALVDGDAISGVGVTSNRRNTAVFLDDADAIITAKTTAALQAFAWAANTGTASEFTGKNLERVLMYNGDITAGVGALGIGYENLV